MSKYNKYSKYIVVCVMFVAAFCAVPFNIVKAAPLEPLSEDIFQWVQATPRSSYYFNKQAMTYEIGADGYADTNILIVPTVRLFDNMQIQDIITKRQWRNLSNYRFNELSGVAEYLRIDLKRKVVEYTECTYLDQGYNSLYVNYDRPEQNIETMSNKDVDYNFYQAILAYEQEHRWELLEKSIDVLRPDDLKLLEDKQKQDKEIEKQKEKQEKKAKKNREKK